MATMNFDLPASLSPAALANGGRGRSASVGTPGEDPTPDSRIGYVILGLFFVLFLGWAAVARLDAAALSPGKLVVDGQRQTIQHREGGVVGQILVKEGQHVEKDQVLFRLAAADVVAQERALSAQAITLLAQRARLQAEQLRRGTITPPAEFAQFTNPADRVAMGEAMRIQQVQLQTRLSVLNATRGALGQRSSGAGNLGQGYNRQVAAINQQIASLNSELESLRDVANKGFVSQNRIRALERARAELEGQRGQFSATAAQTRDQAGEARLQSLEAQASYLERTASELRDVEAALNDVMPKLNAARDQLSRTEIKSPVAGTVMGLQVFTPGAVIAPGQRLMDVVPQSADLTIEGKLALQDGDDVFRGQKAFVSFDTLHERSLPPLEGKVTRVSADSFTDEKTGESFFTVSVAVPTSEMNKIKQVRGSDFELRAGMPVSINIPVRARTALQYMFEPLTAALRRSGKEH